MSGWSDGSERDPRTDPWSEAPAPSAAGPAAGEPADSVPDQDSAMDQKPDQDSATDQESERASGGRRRWGRGTRVAIGMGAAIVVLAAIGIAGRVLEPDPTSDPCAAAPSRPVDAFFADAGGVETIRTTPPRSSTQRCVWMLGASAEVDASAYRRLEITFGLVDGEDYLERVRRRAEHGSAGESTEPDGRTVTAVESDEGRTAFRWATVQRGRTDGSKDVMVQVSAYAEPSGPDVERIRDLVSAIADNLRPMRESALPDAPGTATRMLLDPGEGNAGVREDAADRLQAEGLDLAGTRECVRALSEPLADVPGEYGVSSETRCFWFSDRGSVQVRMGTAADAVTARNAYAELSVANHPYARLASRDPPADLGAGAETRMLVGRIGFAFETPATDGLRAVEVAAIRGDAVVLVRYQGVGGERGDTLEPEQAERAALRLARVALDHL